MQKNNKKAIITNVFLRLVKKFKKELRQIVYSYNLMIQIKPGKKIFYFGIPMHSNLGDLAQYVCIRDFLSEYFSEYNVIEIDSLAYLNKHTLLRGFIKRKSTNSDLIFFQSGYCTQDLGGVENYMHQTVIQDYPNNKMVMLPQTIFFKSPKIQKLTSEIYNNHKKLVFLARDQVSYDIAQNIFSDIPVYLYPDIVTTMIGNYSFNENRKGILMCIRNDDEKFYNNFQIDILKNTLSSLDIIKQIDTTINSNINANTLHLRQIILNYIREFAKYKVIITDRYHGTIFALIANTPVIVIKTKDHKVVTGVKWFQNIYSENIVYVDDIMLVSNAVEQILKREKIQDNKPYFSTHYYSKLKSILEKEWMEI